MTAISRSPTHRSRVAGSSVPAPRNDHPRFTLGTITTGTGAGSANSWLGVPRRPARADHDEVGGYRRVGGSEEHGARVPIAHKPAPSCRVESGLAREHPDRLF